VSVDVVVTGQQKFLTVQNEAEADQDIAGILNPSTDAAVKPMSLAEARQDLARREAQQAS
jgi:hypothetical protein